MAITFVGELARDTDAYLNSGFSPVSVTVHESSIDLEVGQVLVVWSYNVGFEVEYDSTIHSFTYGGFPAQFVQFFYANEAVMAATLRGRILASPGYNPWGFVAARFDGFVNTEAEDDPTDLERSKTYSSATDIYSDYDVSTDVDSTDNEELFISNVFVAPVHTFPTPPAADADGVVVTPDNVLWTPLSTLTIESGPFFPLGDPYTIHYTLAPFYIITTVTDRYFSEGTLDDEYLPTVTTKSLRKLADFGDADVEEPPEPPVVGTSGIDVIATYPGKHVVYRIDNRILVYNTLNDGNGEPYYAEVATDAADESIPTIAADRFDNIYVAYHIEGGGVRIHKSPTYGASWALWRTVPSVYWPRMRFAQDRAYLALWAAGTLDLYESTDYLATTALALTFSATEQLVDLGIDRKGGRYLVYEGAGTNVLMRYSPDGETWNSPVTLAAGGRPAWAHFYAFGILYFFLAGVLYGLRISSDYQSAAGSPIPITSEIAVQYLAFDVDRKDNPWIYWIFVPETPPTPPDPPATIFWGTSFPSGPGQFTTATPETELPELGFGGQQLQGYGSSFGAFEEPP